MKTPTTILSFLRFNTEGAVEKVSWHRHSDGSKTSSTEPHKPTADELARMAADPHGETRC
jgi:hypothetical protein